MILPYFHRWIIACRLTINIRGRGENPPKGLKKEIFLLDGSGFDSAAFDMSYIQPELMSKAGRM
jgi:hypothetical protein